MLPEQPRRPESALTRVGPRLAPQKKFSELQMSTAVEGKSQEYIVKSLEEAQEERQNLRAKNVELQKEVDELRGINLQQQTQLLDHQNTKLALAEAESKVRARPAAK